MKRNFEESSQEAFSDAAFSDAAFSDAVSMRPKGAAASNGGGKGAGSVGQMAMKILLSDREASMLLGHGGAFTKEVGRATGSRLHLSGRHDFFPGTQLQEMAVRGATVEGVAAACTQILEHITAEQGTVSGGDDLMQGQARIRLVIPTQAAKAVLGKSGSNIQELRRNTGLKVHIEEVCYGDGELAEQVINIIGDQTVAISAGLSNVIERVSTFLEMPWFPAWATTSNAGGEGYVAASLAKGAGKGKEKGHEAYGKAGPPKGCGKAAPAASFSGWGSGGYESHAPSFGGKGKGGWSAPAAVAGAPGIDMLASAASVLPPGQLNENGHSVMFNIPAQCVSAVIGKGGAGTKEITGLTGAKINIREIAENEAEKVCLIQGTPIGVASAYMYVIARLDPSYEDPSKGGGKGKSKKGDAYYW